MSKTSFIRHEYSNAVVNTDTQSLNKYKADRLYYRKMEVLQRDVSEIKSSLVKICERIEKLENN